MKKYIKTIIFLFVIILITMVTFLKKTKDEKTSKIEELIAVKIEGLVKNEGIYEMIKGSNVSDLIEESGGLKENADIDNIDYDKILVNNDIISIDYKKNKEESLTSNKEEVNNVSSEKININSRFICI